MVPDADTPERPSGTTDSPGRESGDATAPGRESGDATASGRQPIPHARTDRQSAGRSVDVTPETLYLTRIVVQQARIDALESTLQRQERDLQHVIDRYEQLLTARTQTGEPITDGGRDTEHGSSEGSTDGLVGRTLAALRRRL